MAQWYAHNLQTIRLFLPHFNTVNNVSICKLRLIGKRGMYHICISWWWKYVFFFLNLFSKQCISSLIQRPHSAYIAHFNSNFTPANMYTDVHRPPSPGVTKINGQVWAHRRGEVLKIYSPSSCHNSPPSAMVMKAWWEEASFSSRSHQQSVASSFFRCREACL